ncbi:MAG: S-adenosylmethionine:tRNA ribosyltransferase-isomerase, partial [Actinomycetota bacterium]|nr:S-adenosylmethionine:tRNA ribosyltransferase-isomerase [Actinomycetota bacterium]
MRGAGNTARLVGLPAAAGPIEASGRRRDEGRLLVVGPSAVVDSTFGAVGDFLAPGDVLVVNTSGTLAAALPVQGPAFGRGGPEGLLLHLGTELPGGLRLVELRTATGSGSAPFGDTRPGAVRLPGGGRADLLSPWPATAAARPGPDELWGGATAPAEGPARLWVARLDVPGDPLLWLA